MDTLQYQQKDWHCLYLISNAVGKQERKYHLFHLKQLQTQYLDVFWERSLYINEISILSTDLPFIFSNWISEIPSIVSRCNSCKQPQ